MLRDIGMDRHVANEDNTVSNKLGRACCHCSPVLELYHPAILDGGQFLIWGAVLLKEALKWDTAIVVPPLELRLTLFN